MKLYQLLLILALVFWGCGAYKKDIAPQNFKQVEIPNNGDLEFLSAYDELNMGNEESAFEKFYALYKKTNSNVCLKEAFRLAFILKNDKLDELSKLAALHLKNDNEALRILIGNDIMNGKIAKAKARAKKLVSAESKNAQNHSILGTIYALDNSHALALFEFRTAYSIEPSEMNLLKLVDMYENILHKRTEAIKYAQDWVKKFGCSKQVCLVLMGFYAQNQDVKSMVGIYEGLFDRFKEESFLKDALSLLLVQKDFIGARILLEKYQFDDLMLMEVYAQLGLFNEAYDMALKLYSQSGNYDFMARMAIYKYEKNGKKTSEFEIKQVVELFENSVYKSEDAVFYNYYGYLLIDHDIDVEKGLELVLKAYEIDPNALFIIDSVAWGYYKMGECKKAKDWMERVLADKQMADSQDVKEHTKAINKCLMEKK